MPISGVMAALAVSDVCRATGKRMLTRRQALAEAAWWRSRRFARMRHYQCGRCGRHHIANDRRKPATRR